MSLASERASSKYDDLLARAVSRLPEPSPDSRREIYRRAQAALQRRLRGQRPQMPEADIAREEGALNDAIARVEAHAEKAAGRGEAEGDGERPAHSWLVELMRRAALDGPEVEPAPSAIDFAPKRARAYAPPPRPAFFPRLVTDRDAPAPKKAQEPRSRSAPNAEEAQAFLSRLCESVGAEASALVSPDGSIIASAMSDGMEEARLAAIASALKSLGVGAAAALACGTAQEAIIRGEAGYAILIGEGNALLLTVAKDAGKLGAIRAQMYEAIKSLRSSPPLQ